MISLATKMSLVLVTQTVLYGIGRVGKHVGS